MAIKLTEKQKMLDNILKYTYEINDITISIDGKKYPLKGDRFLSFLMVNNYTSSLIPYIELTLMLSEKEVDDLFKAKKYQVYLKLSEIIYDVNDQLKSKYVVLDKVYDCQIDFNNFIPKSVTLNNKPPEMDMRPYVFYLFLEKDINFFRLKIDSIYQRITPISALAALLVDRKIDRRAIASKPTNTAIINNCMIPFGDLVLNIEHLVKNYGLYSTKPIIFKDIDTLMIVDYTSNPIDIKGEKSVIEIKEINEDRNNAVIFPVLKTEKNDNKFILMHPRLYKNSITNSLQDRITTPNVITVDENGKVNRNVNNKDITNVSLIRGNHNLSESLAYKGGSDVDTYTLEFPATPFSIFKPYKKVTITGEGTNSNYGIFSHSLQLNSNTKINNKLLPINTIAIKRIKK